MKESLRHLDQRFEELRPLLKAKRPPRGWVRAIRDALGMTATQLAKRMGVAQPRITELEKAELSGRITFDSLERAAEALGCRVIYTLLPEEPLAKRVRARAEKCADKQLAEVGQTMGLENQSVSDKVAQTEMRQKLIEELMQKPARLWDEE
ncbi:MAG: mobile mystery protein A [Alphaproteobacteria bacterium]|nr:mobile mystery protein A [Alphaproteobacteria bacterium]